MLETSILVQPMARLLAMSWTASYHRILVRIDETNLLYCVPLNDMPYEASKQCAEIDHPFGQ
jgi:hypothetical protein